MHRIYEWIKFFFKEKVNIFFRGFTGGSVLSGIFLFGSNFHEQTILIYAYLIKIMAVGVSGVLSGFATVLGNDIYHWMKSKALNRKTVLKSKRRKKAA